MPEISAALNQLGADAACNQLTPAKESRVRELIAELRAIYDETIQQLAS